MSVKRFLLKVKLVLKQPHNNVIVFVLEKLEKVVTHVWHLSPLLMTPFLNLPQSMIQEKEDCCVLAWVLTKPPRNALNPMLLKTSPKCVQPTLTVHPRLENQENVPVRIITRKEKPCVNPPMTRRWFNMPNKLNHGTKRT